MQFPDLNGLTAQMLGQQQAYTQHDATTATYPYPPATYNPPVSASPWDSSTNEDIRRTVEKEKRRAGIECPEDEISEFKQLSNHDFHDLLDTFKELICD